MAGKVLVALVAGGLFLFGVPAGAPKGVDSGFGIRSAEAKDYFTRKRVNGRWIRGKFAKRSRSAVVASAAPAAVVAAVADPAPAAGPEPVRVVRPEPAATGSLVAVPLTALPAPPLPDRAALSPQPPRGLFFPERVIRSVSIDFRTGIKTIFYEDGGIVEEPDTGAPIVAQTIHLLPLLPREALQAP